MAVKGREYFPKSDHGHQTRKIKLLKDCLFSVNDLGCVGGTVIVSQRMNYVQHNDSELNPWDKCVNPLKLALTVVKGGKCIC